MNTIGLQRIQQHKDQSAGYDQQQDRTVYKRITPEGIRDALWLFYYGFDEQTKIDGAYARSIILDELTFADRIWAVKPVNDRWLGPLPRNLLEVLDMQTELWMGTSYREQVRTINLINRLGDDGRKALRTNANKSKDYHYVDLKEIEIEVQRGFFTYFVEEMEVFESAYRQAVPQLRTVTP